MIVYCIGTHVLLNFSKRLRTGLRPVGRQRLSSALSSGGGPRFDPLCGRISVDFPGFSGGLQHMLGIGVRDQSLQDKHVGVSIGYRS